MRGKPISIALNSQNIQQKIYMVRGKQVMLDSELAEIYGVESKRLNEQVKRNIAQKIPSICFYRTGCVNVISCLKEQNRSRDKHQNYK